MPTKSAQIIKFKIDSIRIILYNCSQYPLSGEFDFLKLLRVAMVNSKSRNWLGLKKVIFIYAGSLAITHGSDKLGKNILKITKNKVKNIELKLLYTNDKCIGKIHTKNWKGLVEMNEIAV